MSIDKKITAHDIAKKAGVAQSTLSKVLNNYPYISETTKKKVLKAIEDLNYIPDPVARSMVTGKTKTIGLIVGDIKNPFYSESAKIVFNTARELGFNTIIYEKDLGPIEKSIRDLINRRVDGLLISSVLRNDIFSSDILHEKTPLLFYNQIPNLEDINFVKLNDRKGGFMATEYLIKLGYEEIIYIGGDNRSSTYEERYIGYKEALQHYGLNLKTYSVYTGDLERNRISKFLQDRQNILNRSTSVFCASDAIALDVMAELKNMSINVPADISLMGFGDISISSHPLIELTTISQDIQLMSISATRGLIDILQGKQKIVRKVIEPRLIIRNSTKKL